MQDFDRRVFLVPAIHGGTDENWPAGTVEYQVSDGLPGWRSTAFSFDSLAPAVACFKDVVERGWAEAATGARDVYDPSEE